MTRTLLLGATLALAAYLAACSKTEPPEREVAPAESIPPILAAPSTPAPEPVSSASASAPTPNSPPTATSAPAIAAAPAVESVHPSAPQSPTCGDKPLPPCPLYAWMKANTSPAMAARDFGAMATALDKIVAFAPPHYPNWASIARDGSSAARVQDYDAVRAACRGCHNQYKDRYKKEMRDRTL